MIFFYYILVRIYRVCAGVPDMLEHITCSYILLTCLIAFTRDGIWPWDFLWDKLFMCKFIFFNGYRAILLSFLVFLVKAIYSEILFSWQLLKYVWKVTVLRLQIACLVLEGLCTLVGCLRAIASEEEVGKGKNLGNHKDCRHTAGFQGEISFSMGDRS